MRRAMRPQATSPERPNGDHHGTKLAGYDIGKGHVLERLSLLLERSDCPISCQSVRKLVPGSPIRAVRESSWPEGAVIWEMSDDRRAKPRPYVSNKRWLERQAFDQNCRSVSLNRYAAHQPQVVQDVLEFRFHAVGNGRADNDGELDSHAEIVPGPEIRQHLGSEPVPDFGWHGTDKP